ncbi:class I tRNA ligase family protein [Candidatus Parcubacteria bacterium]|nr:class I tRNA ligase family protein [Candidatus Parcubacteria bacterium]
MPEDKGLSRSQREEKVLQFWKENNIFEKTLDKKSPKGDFVFYEGPPTANGKPGIHHLESRAFKDAVPRYKTMRGYRVPRKAGWDTHGLPVELQIEKKLGFKSKKDIEAYGVEKFNKECRESVFEYISEWERFTDRIGYWVNLKDAYYTFDNSYIESVWGVISHVEKRKLLYKDYKVLPWCPRCGTALSSHELAQGYEDVKDLSVYAKFKLVGEENTYLLAWTTTPWTLPGNVALAVGTNMDYVKIRQNSAGQMNGPGKYGEYPSPTGNGETYVLSKKIFLDKKNNTSFFENAGYEIVEEIKGSNLVGLAYEPLYDYLADSISVFNIPGKDKAFKIYAADFVNTDDGTGIVHTAVMYGQDDFELGTKIGLPKYHLVLDDGHYKIFQKLQNDQKSNTEFLSGRYVHEADENGKPTLAVDIIDDLKVRNLFFKQENVKHSYPHCWRCKTPLIYYARDSWYIRMSDLRDKLTKENEKINWEPSYIKEGRFGEWLREVKDWAISRERYWGTPLPVWQTEDGKDRIVVDSIDTLKKYAKTNGNTYFVMRHGQAENNVRRIVSTCLENSHHLSDLGKEQSAKTAGKLKKIDLIVASPFARTKETAEIAAQKLGVDKDSIIFDERLREFDAGDFEGKSEDEMHTFLNSRDMWSGRCEGGENFDETKRRLGQALDSLDREHQGKRILIVTHKIPAWLLIVAGKRFNAKESEAMDVYLENAEVRPLELDHLPHNDNFELDLHKPYIDDVVLVKDGKEYRRVKEVMDVWLDSGSMSLASGAGYPADFISEGIDQTRGWFYTLHAVGVLMEKGRAFKNAICLGLILDKEGKKMSKSVGNVIDPWQMIEKYGVDTLRLWMYSVNQPGEPKNFDEKTVDELNKRVFNLLDNVYAFFELYRDKSLESEDMRLSERHILDKWILARLNETAGSMTEKLDGYKLLEPVRTLRDFIDDLSTWYLRRSRDRLKDGDAGAKQTLYYVLKSVSKLLAPFAPFYADELFQKLRVSEDVESVHLSDWVSGKAVDEKVIKNMERTRLIVSQTLEARSKANIKIRQPLALLVAKLDGAYAELIRDEVNVKEVKDSDIEGVTLDTNLNPELIEEGRVRDIIRSIQEMRKEKDLKPGDVMQYEVPEEHKELFIKYADEVKRATNIDPVL